MPEIPIKYSPDAGALEIEITPVMIKAGVEALRSWDEGAQMLNCLSPDGEARLVEAILVAVLNTPPKPHKANSRSGVSDIVSEIPEPLREVMRQNSKNLEQVISESDKMRCVTLIRTK